MKSKELPINFPPRSLRSFSLIVVCLALGACARSGISPQAISPEHPEAWRAKANSEAVAPAWLVQQSDEKLVNLVEEALGNNFALAQSEAELEAASQQAVIAGAPLYPEFDLGLDGSRVKTINDETSQLNTNIQVDLSLSWELDLWGKLSDSKRQAVLSLRSKELDLKQAKLQLAADVTQAWYNLLQAQQLLELFEERLATLDRSQEIIEFGYRQGITPALDVYLARNEVELERARLAQQRQDKFEAVNRLEFLLGRYPSGKMQIDAELPVIENLIAAGLPSDLLKRSPSIQAAWFNLMAADAGLAVAHKARFPSLRITGSIGDSADALSRLLDGGPLGWSLIGGLTQPVFAGGKLAAREKQAEAELRQSEQRYLNLLFNAFTDVENTLNRQHALSQRYQNFLRAQENALTAQRLAFEQYQRGLSSYTSVLESQRRAFDAQSTVLELRNQLLQNRISLNLALGGSAIAATE